MRIQQFRSKLFLFVFISLICTLLSGCGSSPTRSRNARPSTTHNACIIFREHPRWYWEALDTYYRWGVPISVQMAIMRRESDFQAGARPPKKKFFGVLPSWSNVSSAYGYAQALNGTWREYQRETGQHDTRRDAFGDASDFVGWYCYKAHKRLGISRRNAYALYLAYHEGMGGYAKRSYRKKPWLLKVARLVQRQAKKYRTQISSCKYSIPKVPVD